MCELGGFAGIDLNEQSQGKPSESDNRWCQFIWNDADIICIPYYDLSIGKNDKDFS